MSMSFTDILFSPPLATGMQVFNAVTPQVSSNPVDDLYLINRDWAEDQAQKQMDYQTAANKIAMNFEREEAEKARQYATQMSNTAYQRAVQDLKKAGLNPILAYSQGGASVPSVSSASGYASSGAKASMSDTGYTSDKAAADAEKTNANLKLDAMQMVLNTATDIVHAITSLVPF